MFGEPRMFYCTMVANNKTKIALRKPCQVPVQGTVSNMPGKRGGEMFQGIKKGSIDIDAYAFEGMLLEGRMHTEQNLLVLQQCWSNNNEWGWHMHCRWWVSTLIAFYIWIKEHQDRPSLQIISVIYSATHLKMRYVFNQRNIKSPLMSDPAHNKTMYMIV